MDKRPIGIMDSGVGGLSAVRALLRARPEESFCYLGDEAHMPYGVLDHDTLVRYGLANLHFLLRQDVKAVLTACGTLSAEALDILSAHCPVPILGVIDAAAREAARITQSKRVGIIGTRVTIENGAFERRIASEDPAIQTLGIACPQLVILAEQGHLSPEDSLLQEATEGYLSPIRAFGADTLILGCTHFSVLRDALQALLPGVTLVDASAAAVSALLTVLGSEDLLAPDGIQGRGRVCVTAGAQGFTDIAERFIGSDFSFPVETVTL